MNKMVPCKYCKSEPKLKTILFAYYTVECERCCRAIPFPSVTTKEAAIMEWNKENE